MGATVQQMITHALELEHAELARIQTEAAQRTAASAARIRALTAAQTAVTDDVQTLLESLASVGFAISFG